MRRKKTRSRPATSASPDSDGVGGRRLRFVAQDDLRRAVEAAYARAMEVPFGEVDPEVRQAVVSAGVESFLRQLGPEARTGRASDGGADEPGGAGSVERLTVEETSADAAHRSLSRSGSPLRVMGQQDLRGALAGAFERALRVEFSGIEAEVLDTVIEAGVRNFFHRIKSGPVLEPSTEEFVELRQKVEGSLLATLRERFGEIDGDLLATVVREGLRGSFTAPGAAAVDARAYSSAQFLSLAARIEAALVDSQRRAGARLEELQSGVQALQTPLETSPAVRPPVPAVPQVSRDAQAESGEDSAADIEAGIRGLLAQSDQLRDRAIRMAMDAVRAEMRGREGVAMGSPEHRIELLERRIAKLTGSLETAEKELSRIAGQTGADPGLASIYRTVQGLAADAHEAEAKRRLLADLFTANQELRRQISDRKPPPKD